MSSSNANNVVSTFCNQLSSLSFNGQLHNVGYKNASDIIQQGIHSKKQLDSNHQWHDCFCLCLFTRRHAIASSWTCSLENQLP